VSFVEEIVIPNQLVAATIFIPPLPPFPIVVIGLFAVRLAQPRSSPLNESSEFEQFGTLAGCWCLNWRQALDARRAASRSDHLSRVDRISGWFRPWRLPHEALCRVISHLSVANFLFVDCPLRSSRLSKVPRRRERDKPATAPDRTTASRTAIHLYISSRFRR
jgi:hypothetical protein